MKKETILAVQNFTRSVLVLAHAVSSVAGTDTIQLVYQAGNKLNEALAEEGRSPDPSATVNKVETHESKGGFESALMELINKHSLESGSNTPDHILARYMCRCLEAYNHAVALREKWYGRGPKACCGQVPKQTDEVPFHPPGM